MVTCTRRLEFCAGHRVMGHENKCAHLHGHNYRVLLTAAAQVRDDVTGLDSVGRVIDFAALKGRFLPWLEARWDHGFLLHREDEAAIRALGEFERVRNAQDPPTEWRQESGDPLDLVARAPFVQRVALLPVNPTAENLALYLFALGAKLLPPGVFLTRVRVWETPNCYADAAGLPSWAEEVEA